MSDERRPRWTTLSDDEREQQYSPSSMLDGPLDPLLDDYARRSAEAYEAATELTTVRYGPRPGNTIDVALPRPAARSRPAPLHVFIHGGYWQQLSKRESFFAAPAFLRSGAGFAAIDYTLAPAATLDEIVAECVVAVSTLRSEAADRGILGIDPDNLVVSGSSAGAHLAASVATRLPSDQRPAAVILLSGIYELEPLIGTSINDAVGLDVDAARRNSPLRAELTGFPPAVVAWGENETDEFKRQSCALVDRLRTAGRPVTEIEVQGRNHFDIVFDLPALAEQIPEESEPGA